MTDNTAPTSRRATISLALGATAFVGLFFFPFIGIVLGIPAATNGVLAKREIDNADADEPLGGRQWADYGIAAGIVALIFGLGLIGWDLLDGK